MQGGDDAAQQAAWVLDGSVKELSESELQVFLLSPSGLQFILAPYQVGPWVEGSFTVLLSLEELDGLLDADGSAFVIHAGPDDQVTDPSGNSGDRIACGVFSAS